MNHMEDLKRWRGEFPILERCVYLINNSLGAMPGRTRDQMLAYTDAWATRGVQAWEDRWWMLAAEIGDLISPLLGVAAGTVSVQPNVTTAQWVAFSSLPRKGRRKVVYSALNFPSVRYFYQEQPDLEVEVVPCPDGQTVPTEALLEAIDEKTLAVPISHVVFKSAYIQEIDAIVEKAHSVGAYVILDTYHSCGVIPMDLAKLRVDFAVGGVLKWLCGGPGTAFLYVRPDLIQTLRPSLTGWLAHRDPFAFSAEMEHTDTAYRFQSGTPSIPALYAAESGLRILGEVGVEQVRERSVDLTERLVQRADEYGIPIRSPRDPRQRGGHVTMDPPDCGRISRQLLDRGFIIDYRPDSGIRVAPHFFNTVEEVDAVMDAIRELCGR